MNIITRVAVVSNKRDRLETPAPACYSQKEITLRDYQKNMVALVYAAIRSGYNRLLMVVIMGAGKTITSAWMIRDAVTKGHRCVFLVPLNVLLEQTAESLRDLGVPCTILQGSRRLDPSAPVVVASAQTINSRVARGGGAALDRLLGNPKLIVVDEAHNTAFSAAYDAISSHYPSALVVGLTATPWRLSPKEWLGQKFDKLIEGPQAPDIVAMGSAVPCRGFTLTGAIDLETLHTRNGDYIDSEISSQACKPEALEHVYQEWRRLCSDRPTLMIGATVQQAKITQAVFTGHGVAAALIVGDTPQAERMAIFEQVKAGEVQVICSVGCLTAGFNLPIISAVLYVRATKSKALFFQTAGRGSRPWPAKADYILLDFGGNLRRFGNPMGYQDYGISEPVFIPFDPPTKTCPGCGAEVSNFAQVCPNCGWEFLGDALGLEDDRDPVLQSLNEYVDRFTREKITRLRAWRKDAFLQGLPPDDATDRFTHAYGHHPPAEWLAHAALGRRVSNRRKLAFFNYLQAHCKPGQWAEHWMAHHLRLEFGTQDLEQIGLFTDWDEVLGVHYSADWETAKAAYRERIKHLPDDHPDHERLALALEDAKATLRGAAS